MLTDDRDIRRTHRVGTSSQLEANFGENDAEIPTVEMLAEQEHEPGDDLAVLESNRGHANDPSSHQFAAGIVVREPFQFLRGDETRALGHRQLL